MGVSLFAIIPTPGPAPAEACVALIQCCGDGAMFYRFRLDGAFAGDSWHPSLEAAIREARLEYPGSSATWNEVPSGERDFLAFALHAASDHTGA